MDKLMKWTGIVGVGIAVLSMAVIIYFGIHKVVVIANVSNGVSDATDEDSFIEREALEGTEVKLSKSNVYGEIRIPLEKEVRAENISMENQYMNKELLIHIPEATAVFYDTHSIEDGGTYIVDAVYSTSRDELRLYLKLKDIYEFESHLDDGVLVIRVLKPSKTYDKIVAIDIRNEYVSNESSKEALEKIVQDIISNAENQKIKYYYLELGDHNISDGEKADFVNEVGADLYIGIGFASDIDSSKFGSFTEYNSTYYLPGLGNVQLADIMEQETVAAISGKALGLVDSQDVLLGQLEIPAAIIYPGYVSNSTEKMLLEKASYQNKIAIGIENAIERIYEENLDK